MTVGFCSRATSPLTLVPHLLLAGLLACGPTDHPDAGTADAGERDAGELDAGHPSDAGGEVDAGSPVDAGVDAGESDDAGVDAGPSADAGMDAGAVDAGVRETMSVRIIANPNNVLSAAAQVSWAGPIVSVYIFYTWGLGNYDETPTVSVAGATGGVTLPVLALHAGTEYAMQAIGLDATGKATASTFSKFTTGELPAPVPSFTVADGGVASPGYTMVARIPISGLFFDYVTIVDGKGNTVWYYNAAPGLEGEFEQELDGTIMMSIDDPPQTILGLDDASVIHRQVDVFGNLIHDWRAVDVPLAVPPITVTATNDHEARLLANGDALLFGLVEETMDTTALGGTANNTVVGDVLERVTAGGVPAFAWDAFEYLDISEIDANCANLKAKILDFTHANAASVMTDGNYLVSSRNLSQAIKIDSVTGRMLWRLGGAKGQFTFVNDPMNGFSCQHGVRELPNGHIILYDDGDGHTPQVSRAVEYALDLASMTATMVWEASADPALYSYVLGYAQRLENGNTLITYGTESRTQEVDPVGNLLWDLATPIPTFGFYRALRIGSLYPPAP